MRGSTVMYTMRVVAVGLSSIATAATTLGQTLEVSGPGPPASSGERLIWTGAVTTTGKGTFLFGIDVPDTTGLSTDLQPESLGQFQTIIEIARGRWYFVTTTSDSPARLHLTIAGSADTFRNASDVSYDWYVVGQQSESGAFNGPVLIQPAAGASGVEDDEVLALVQVVAAVQGAFVARDTDAARLEYLNEEIDLQYKLNRLRIGRLILDQSGRTERRIVDIDALLIDLHLRYKEFNNRPSWENDLEQVEESLHDLFAARDLAAMFAAVIRPGFFFGQGGQQSSDFLDTDAADAAGSVAWTTKHWQDEEFFWDYHLSGRLGIVPVLARWDEGNGDGSEQEHWRHGSGFIYDAFLHFNIKDHGSAIATDWLPKSAEMSVFAGGGQTLLLADTLSVAGAEGPRALVPAGETDGWQSRAEFGLEFRLYDREMKYIHHERSLLSPRMAVAYGLRRDPRYESGLGSIFDVNRKFARFSIDFRRVLGGATAARENYGFRFVVEHEWGRKGRGPSGTAVIVEGEVNVWNLLSATSSNGS